ncbi:hypothetical protein B0H19DRAFT_1180438 [Mycena capillaripes]|nr:hypothetical protein B0H19DRAFT_1180438 [Mycena capillaripes]
MQDMTTPQDVFLKTLAPSSSRPQATSILVIFDQELSCRWFLAPSRLEILSSSPPQVLFASPHKQSTALCHPGHIVCCRRPRATEMKR